METKKCQVCNKKHEAKEWWPLFTYGVKEATGWSCEKLFEPKKPILRAKPDHVPESLKEDRKKYAKSMLQPWREGEPSAEFIEAYPKQAKKMFTEKERMKAREVWKGEPNYTNWRKSE